jgi:hypothetical protein
MPAQRGAAFLHVPLSAFTFGFENALLMFSYALVFGDIGNGNSMRLDYYVADTLSVRDLSCSFGIPIRTKILLASNGRFTLFSSCTHLCCSYRHCLFLGSVNYDPFSRRNQEAKTFYCSFSSRASHRAIGE